MTTTAFDEWAFRVALAAAGFKSVAALARSADVSTSYVRQVAAGFVPSRRVRALLAAKLGVDEETIWPRASVAAEALAPLELAE